MLMNSEWLLALCFVTFFLSWSLATRETLSTKDLSGSHNSVFVEPRQPDKGKFFIAYKTAVYFSFECQVYVSFYMC